MRETDVDPDARITRTGFDIGCERANAPIERVGAKQQAGAIVMYIVKQIVMYDANGFTGGQCDRARLEFRFWHERDDLVLRPRGRRGGTQLDLTVRGRVARLKRG